MRVLHDKFAICRYTFYPSDLEEGVSRQKACLITFLFNGELEYFHYNTECKKCRIYLLFLPAPKANLEEI